MSEELGRLKVEKAAVEPQLAPLAVSHNDELAAAQRALASQTEALAGTQERLSPSSASA